MHEFVCFWNLYPEIPVNKQTLAGLLAHPRLRSLPVVSFQLSAIRYQFPVIRYQLFLTVFCSLFSAYRFLFTGHCFTVAMVFRIR
ncbi:MAG: hypothetical protein H6Q17_2268 [Bacteroidetes bacterium]|jgi:hypothetical protein|nr:hypothetical protein [Bacteroidota bacterium]